MHIGLPLTGWGTTFDSTPKTSRMMSAVNRAGKLAVRILGHKHGRGPNAAIFAFSSASPEYPSAHTVRMTVATPEQLLQ